LYVDFSEYEPNQDNRNYPFPPGDYSFIYHHIYFLNNRIAAFATPNA
jgi:hypothetical protein